MLFLSFTVNGQIIHDTLMFPDYQKDLKTILMYKPEIKQPKFYGTMAVIVSTFLINEAIIRYDTNCGNYKNITKKTGIIYLTGVTTSVIVFRFELKRNKKH